MPMHANAPLTADGKLGLIELDHAIADGFQSAPRGLDGSIVAGDPR